MSQYCWICVLAEDEIVMLEQYRLSLPVEQLKTSSVLLLFDLCHYCTVCYKT